MLRISQKIIFSFLFLALLSFGCLFYNIQQTQRIEQLTFELSDERSQTERIFTSIYAGISRYQSGLETIPALLDLEVLGQENARLEVTLVRVFELLATLKKQNPTLYGEVSENLIQDMAMLSQYQQELFALMNNFAQQQSATVYGQKIIPIIDQTDQDLERISQLAQEHYDLRKAFVEKQLTQSTFLTYASIGVLLFCFLFTGLYLWTGTIRPVSALTSFVKNPESLRNSLNVPFLKRKDEIGDFSRSFMEMMVEREATEALVRENGFELEKAAKDADAARKEAEVIAQIPESNSSPVLRLSETGEVIYFNKATEEMFPAISQMGLDHPVLKGVDVLLFMLQTQALGVQKREIEYSNDIVYLRNLVPIYTDHTTSLAVFIQDISDIKNAQREAEQANRSKDDFLANMSHELRTPLNSILGMTEILKKQGLDEEQREMFSIVEVSSNNLLKIVNDILDLSRIEAGETRLEHIPFDLIGEIKQTLDSMKPIASKKGLTFRFDNQIKDDFFVYGDPLRLSRILINLTNNAIAYTEEGSVNVIASAQSCSESIRTLRIEIQDTGIGIEENRIDAIFDKFTQADTSTTRKYGGTGLGLAITRELLDMMGGSIGVESKAGEGSTFWFEAPFETFDAAHETTKDVQAQSTANANANRPTIQDARILLAEDQNMNVLYMKKLFSAYGVKDYKVAHDGSEALTLVQNLDFDLVLMDCHMPVMSGYDATRAIRKLSDETKSALPIIAMTANVMQKDIDQCFEVGMDEYIGKPFTLSKFEDVLSKWVIFDDVEDRPDSLTDDTGQENAPINLGNLRETAMGDEDFVLEMIALFVTQGAKQITDLKSYCVDGDNEDWVEISHALKGTAGTIGAETMRKLCENAQDMREASAQARGDILDTIEAEYLKVKAHLIEKELYTA